MASRVRQYPVTAESTFVLVHGAWHGGWCWEAVASILRAGGHRVTAPTQTGLGDRAHLLSDAVDLNTFVDDIEEHLATRDLCDVILVGHSFGGFVVSVLAERDPSRLRTIVYLDGFLPRHGQSAMDLLPPDVARRRLARARESAGGLTLPVPNGGSLGLTNTDQVSRVEKNMTPHPVKTYLSKVTLHAPLGNGVDCHYIACVDPPYPSIASSHTLARASGWPLYELACGHDAMVHVPHEVAGLLERIAARARSVPDR